MPQDSSVRTPGARSTDPLEGRVLDERYQLGPRIARGGMAAVHEATDLRLHRTVAVKVMHAGLADQAGGGFSARFVREARAAARLSHPGVVAVYDQGNDDGTLYLVMELVDGHTLRDVLTAEAPLEPTRALALLEPVLSALSAAHRAGLVHRDVKPENVLIADDGRVKVADFGLARAVSAESVQTATGGVLIGTVSYLAPELVVADDYDARADVYAAGVVLFEMLTGRKPHDGDTPIQVAYRHVHHDVPAPSSLVRGVPASLDALVARATARDADLRPSDADELLALVHRVAHSLADGVDDPGLVHELAVPGTEPDATEAAWDDDELAELFTFDDGRGDADDRYDEGYDDGRYTRTLQRGHGSGDRYDRYDDDVRYVGERPRRTGRVLLVALVFALCVGGGAYWFGWGRYTATPGVVGEKKSAAVGDLEQAGLTVEWDDEAYSESVPAGEVISTDPEPGSRILDGGTVTVVLSLGPERYEVPDLRGMTEDQAQDALIALHLQPDAGTERYSETVPQGQVIRSDPKPGTELKPDTEVGLVVSQGRRPIEVDSWVGDDLDSARSDIEDRGLSVDVTRVYDDDVPEGEVISQSPEGGTLFRDDTVSLTVSKGPEFVTMPSVKLDPKASAVEKLEDLGLEVRIEKSALYFGAGRVARSDPDAGTSIRVGSTVTLYVI